MVLAVTGLTSCEDAAGVAGGADAGLTDLGGVPSPDPAPEPEPIAQPDAAEPDVAETAPDCPAFEACEAPGFWLCSDKGARRCEIDVLTGCASLAAPVSCDDGSACTADACDTAVGCVHPPAVCNDADVCNGIETCEPEAGCLPGVALVCDDGLPCTGDETCHPQAGC